MRVPGFVGHSLLVHEVDKERSMKEGGGFQMLVSFRTSSPNGVLFYSQGELKDYSDITLVLLCLCSRRQRQRDDLLLHRVRDLKLQGELRLPEHSLLRPKTQGGHGLPSNGGVDDGGGTGRRHYKVYNEALNTV